MIQNRTEGIVQECIDAIYHGMNQRLLEKKLEGKIGEYNQGVFEQVGEQTFGAMYLKEKGKYGGKDSFGKFGKPNSIFVDSCSNFRVKKDDRLSAGKTERKKSKLASRRTRREACSSMMSRRVKEDKTSSQTRRIEIPAFFKEYSYPFELPKKIPKHQEYVDQEIEKEIDIVKKDLYERRKKKRIQDKQKQQMEKREKQLKNKRRPPVLKPGKFTYSFNGEFMYQKSQQKDHFLLPEMKINHSVELKPRKNIINIQQQKTKRKQRQETQQTMRFKKANVFNNSNQRQVSHVPYIQIIQDAKISENNVDNIGKTRQRMTLQAYKETQFQGFRHFREISSENKYFENPEKQIEQTAQKSDRSQEKNIISSDQPQTQRKKKSELHYKSFNIDHINFPQQNSIHRYYKHNFDKDLR